MSPNDVTSPLCDFVRHLDDDELQWLLEAPTLVPELMGLTDHLSFCKECGARGKRVIHGSGREVGVAFDRLPLALAASTQEPGQTDVRQVPFAQLVINNRSVEFTEDAEGRVFLRGPVPETATSLVFGTNRFALVRSSSGAEVEVRGLGLIEFEELVGQIQADPQKFRVAYSE